MIEKIDEMALRLLENGCRMDIVEDLRNLYLENNRDGMMFTLKKYRHELQDTIDCECRLIDCIDCLVYELEKNR